jgi:putative proteasome-type protease
MTHCLALRLNEGLLFLSDTRTNAGVDNVSTFRKLHVLRPAGDRLFVLQSAGNLATTQEVLDRIERDLTLDGPSLATVTRLFEAALYVGRVSVDVATSHQASLGTNATATFLLGGQISGERPDILLIYPEGNYIRASEDLPFLQIGESKYGKFLLEVAARLHVDMETAAKIALSSMMSTARANLSVGPPDDAGVYRNGSLDIELVRIEADSSYLTQLQGAWSDGLLNVINSLPPIPADLLPN